MRAGAGFNATEVAPVGARAGVGQQHSAWHSPVPYLFGGLAAMLGLIAFALLILACSYWKLSGYLDGDDVENGEGDGKPSGKAVKAPTFFEQGIVVIMAGDEKPTFLATPVTSRASSFADHCSTSTTANSSNSNSNKEGGLEIEKKHDEGSNGDGSVSISIPTENQNQDQNQNQQQRYPRLRPD